MTSQRSKELNDSCCTIPTKATKTFLQSTLGEMKGLLTSQRETARRADCRLGLLLPVPTCAVTSDVR